MKTFPLERSLSGHLSISLALTIYALYLVLDKFFNPGAHPRTASIICGVILAGFTISVVLGDGKNVNSGLYNNDINIKYTFLSNAIKIIPRGSSIAFSDECFYLYYLCRQRGDKVTKAPLDNEQYFIRFKKDVLPASCIKSYILLETVYNREITATAYEIYKRREGQ